MPDDLAIHNLILGGRQGGDGLGEHGEGGDVDRDLAGAGAEEGAGGFEDIAQVELLVEELELLLAQVVDPQEELDARGGILDVGEGELAHRAHGAQAPGHGDGDGLRAAGSFGFIEGFQGCLRGVGDVRTGGVGLHPGFAQAFGFFQADLFEVGSFHE